MEKRKMMMNSKRIMKILNEEREDDNGIEQREDNDE